MTHEEMKHVILLEIFAPSEYDKYLFDIPQDVRDEMYSRYKNNEPMSRIVSLIPNEYDRNRMLGLAQLIDEGIEKEKLLEQEKQSEEVPH